MTSRCIELFPQYRSRYSSKSYSHHCTVVLKIEVAAVAPISSSGSNASIVIVFTGDTKLYNVMIAHSYTQSDNTKKN